MKRNTRFTPAMTAYRAAVRANRAAYRAVLGPIVEAGALVDAAFERLTEWEQDDAREWKRKFWPRGTW